MHRWSSGRHALRLVPGRPALLLLVAAGQLAAMLLAWGDHRLWPVALPWLASLVSAVVLVHGWPGRPVWSRPALQRTDALLVAGLTLLAAILRLPRLETMPAGIYGDEGEFGVLALEITRGQGPAPFGVAFLGDPALYVHLLAPFVDAFGPTMQAIRLPSALAGTATVPVVYGLVRSLYGRVPAVLAAAFLATSTVHIHFSRLALNVVWVPLLACLSLWFLHLGLTRRRDIWYLLAGMAAGLAFYFHFGGRLLGPILLLVLAGQLATEPRRWRVWARAAALTGLGGFLSLSPLLAHLAGNPHLLTEHTADRGIWNHWERLADRYGTVPSDKPGILWEQTRRTFAAFITRPDSPEGAQVSRFMDAPLLEPLLGALALLGLAALLLQARKVEARLLLIWFIAPFVFASVLTDVAGQSHRLVHPVVPALVAAALVVDWAVRYARDRLRGVARWVVVLPIVLVPLAAGAWDSFHYFQPGMTDRFAPATTAQARCMEALPAGTAVVVAGEPRIYARHGPSRYLGQHIDRRDLGDPATSLPVDNGGQPLLILVHERNRDALDRINASYPEAPTMEISRPPDERVLTAVAVSEDNGLAISLLGRCVENANSS